MNQGRHREKIFASADDYEMFIVVLREAVNSNYVEKIKRKINSVVGRFIYCKRLGTLEPVFANICSIIGLNRFTLRGKTKVSSQWLMYGMVHNIKKIHQF